MKTGLRVLALVFLALPLVDAIVLSHEDRTVVVAVVGVVIAASRTTRMPAAFAVAAGVVYLASLLRGHVPYDSGALFVGASIVTYLDIAAWSAATPRKAIVSARASMTAAAHLVGALAIGAGLAQLILFGRSRTLHQSVVLWAAGVALFLIALLVPTLTDRSRRG